MPDWALGHVRVEGSSKDIEEFCKLFEFNDTEQQKEYFARSYIDMNWKDFKQAHLGKDCAKFEVEFAWSASRCLIDEYSNDENCLTLVAACKKYNLKVIIDTKGAGMAFEEHIECDKNGDLIEECNITSSLPSWVGSKNPLTDNCDYLSDEEIQSGLKDILRGKTVPIEQVAKNLGIMLR